MFLPVMLLALLPLAQDPHAGHGHGAPAPAPQAPDPVRHLGPLKPRETRSFEWEIKNASSRPALFHLVDPPAALKAGALTLAKPWAPGESRKLAFSVDATGLKGPQAWTLRLRSDDPAQPDQTLPLDFVAVSFGVTPDKVTSLGSIGPKEVKTATWELQNLADGPQSFRLLDLAPGVTVDEAPLATPLAPGETRTLKMTIDPTGFVGYQRRAAKLESSDPAQPRYILRTDMTIRPEMSVDGLTRSLKSVKPFESPEVVYTFTREGGDLAQIKLASELPPYLESEIVPKGKTAELHLTLRPRLLKPGVQAGLELLRVETNAPREPQFSLTFDWRLRLPVKVEPPRVVFESKAGPAQSLTLSSWDKKPFRIRRAELDGEGFSVSPAPARAASRQRFAVKVTAAEEAHAVLKVYLEGSDDPLAVPLSFLPPSAPPPAPAPSPAPAPPTEPPAR